MTPSPFPKPFDPFTTSFINHFESFLSRLPNVILTLVFGYLAIQVLLALFGIALRAARVTKAMEGILHSTVNALLWVGVIALIFQSLGLNQIAIAISGSVALIGVAVATGANKLISDVVAGLFLAKNRDFKVGQRIKMAEAEGQIHSLDLRKVRILGDDGNLYIIPNTKFDEQTWQTLPPKEKHK
jgi:small-conductance mechanosensitive channel